MIEVVSDKACILCDKCVQVCPTNVFDAVPDGAPVIARQSDCQTCFMCEAYCPTDALFVSPEIGPVPADSPFRDEEWLTDNHLIGSYREALGWGKGRKSTAPLSGLLASSEITKAIRDGVPKKAIPGKPGEIAPVLTV